MRSAFLLQPAQRSAGPRPCGGQGFREYCSGARWSEIVTSIKHVSARACGRANIVTGDQYALATPPLLRLEPCHNVEIEMRDTWKVVIEKGLQWFVDVYSGPGPCNGRSPRSFWWRERNVEHASNIERRNPVERFAVVFIEQWPDDPFNFLDGFALLRGLPSTTTGNSSPFAWCTVKNGILPFGNGSSASSYSDSPRRQSA